MRLLIRTWNVFHGNARPPERRAFLGEMVRLATADGPAVVCLQELPVWSLSRLERWSGMNAVGAIAKRPLLPPEPGRIVTDLNHGLLRSAFTGQANAILLRRDLHIAARDSIVLNPRTFRERRVCQVVHVRGSRSLLIANLHATNDSDKRLADNELVRAADFAEESAGSDPIVLAGDFNLSARNSKSLAVLGERGFAGMSPQGIDHVLVRGLPFGRLVRWPVERRTVGGRVLSDHAPVERSVG